MKKLTTFTIFIFINVFSYYCKANSELAEEIESWIDESEGVAWVSNITPIILEDGEEAFLAMAIFPEKERNFEAGYVLARPDLKKAIILENYGGDGYYHDIVSIPSNGASILIISSSGSGGGIMHGKQYIVTFKGWEEKVLHSTEIFNNFGFCGAPLGNEGDCEEPYGVLYDGDCVVRCQGKDVFLNILEGTQNVVKIAKTTVTYDDEKEKITSEILSFHSPPIPESISESPISIQNQSCNMASYDMASGELYVPHLRANLIDSVKDYSVYLLQSDPEVMVFDLDFSRLISLK